jgi:aminoglycoside 2'-N-acetyltransferase I
MQHPTPTIHVVPAASLPSASLEEVLGICDRAYGEDLRPIFRTFELPVHVLGVVDNHIVTHALWVTRWLASGTGAPMRTAYVEAVATEPRYQGRGYASTVMMRVIDAVTDFELAALSASDRGRSLYARLGWETWRGPLYIRNAADVIATPGESAMIHRLPATPFLDTTTALSAEWREGELW